MSDTITTIYSPGSSQVLREQAPQAPDTTERRGDPPENGDPIQQPVPSTDPAPVSSSTSAQVTGPLRAPLSHWTPEVIIQAFKEAVTASLGLLLVGATIRIALDVIYPTQIKVDTETSKQVLNLMLGLAAAVLGYYFGRAPGDARAAQASEQVNTAAAKSEQIADKAEELAAQFDELIASRGDTARMEVHQQHIRKLQTEVRMLSRGRV